ncbi:hypothetical protein E2C01_003341 [Portunus trituberculatus]|uniref:Uncharacterized protein n=1 Tax=Portunus trituberculatus TaxID=210409 RepID=A0A5B7CPI7_PORTR|nr:hypothetical protein [Portunus trituberculatus]
MKVRLEDVSGQEGRQMKVEASGVDVMTVMTGEERRRRRRNKKRRKKRRKVMEEVTRAGTSNLDQSSLS